jgi:hypothetical protein
MEFIGHKTIALFDLWSFCHFLAGVAIGNIMARFLSALAIIKNGNDPDYKAVVSAFLLILFFAYTWEFVEYGLESGRAGLKIAYWFQGQEHWLNRLVSDPLLVITGYMFSCRFQRFIWPARMTLIAWLWIFIFLFPHSMAYL